MTRKNLKAGEKANDKKEEAAGGAQQKTVYEGSASEVQEAIENQAQTRVAVQDPPENAEDEFAEENERDELIDKLLNDAKNMVIVKRLMPRVWHGQAIHASELDGYGCPISIEDLKRDVFERFGGWRFKATIHPATATGHGRILEGFDFANPDTREPLGFEGEGESQESPELDPTLGREEPEHTVQKALEDQARGLAQQIKIKGLKNQIQDMQEESEENGRGRRSRKGEEGDGDRVRKLEQKLEQNELSQKIEGRFSSIEKVLGSLADTLKAPQEDGPLQRQLAEMQRKLDEKTQTNQLAAVIEQSDRNFAKIIEVMKDRKATELQNKLDAFIAAQQNGGGTDAELDRMVKYKALFGSKDSKSDRSDRMEQLMDLALDKLLDGPIKEGGGDDEDPLKFGIKQLMPVLKKALERKAGEEPLSREEQRRIAGEAGRKMAQDIAQRAVAEQRAQEQARLAADSAAHPVPPALPTPPEEPPSTAPAPSPEPPPTPPQPPAAASPPGAAEESPPEEEERYEPPKEGETVNLPGVGDLQIPLKPESEGYDRKKAIAFILAVAQSEIYQRIPWDEHPDDKSFLVGDALDRLDQEVLDDLLGVATGTQLDEFLARHGGDPEKIATLKKSGEDPVCKSFLEKVVITIKDEVIRKKQIGKTA